MNQVDSTGNHKLIRRPSSGGLSDTDENFEVWGFIHPTHRFCSGLIVPLGVDDPEVNGTGAQKMVRCSSINTLHDTFKTFEYRYLRMYAHLTEQSWFYRSLN